MNKFKLAWFATLVATVLALTSCSLGAGIVVPRDISTPEKAMAVPCNEVGAVDKTVDELAASTAPGEKNKLVQWSLDPNNPEQIKASQDALDQRVAQCAASPSPAPASSVTPTPSASPTASIVSPSPTASATPTATTTPAPSSTASPKPVGYIGWDQVGARPPAGLKSAIDTHAVTMGFNWSNVQAWAKTKTKAGNLVDARVVLAFGLPNMSDADARKQAGVETGDVDVVRVTECTDVTGHACDTSDGAVTILAPLVVKDKVATGLRFGSGVVAGTSTLLLYR